MEKETKISRVSGDVNAQCADRMQTADDEAILKQFKVRICFEFWILPENMWSTKTNTQKIFYLSYMLNR